MSRAICLILLAVLLSILLLPQMTSATILYVDITATGSDNTAIPGCPTGLTATVTSGHMITLAWTEGVLTDNSIVRGKWGSYPTSYTDGFAVYNGSDDNATDVQDIAGSEDGLYYRVWGWNTAGYTVCYDEDFAEGGMAGVANAIMLIPLVMLCATLSGIGFWKIRSLWPLLIIGALAWGAMGFWSYTQVEESWDIWFFVGCIGVLALLTHIVLGPWKWIADEEKPVPVEEERLTDRLKKRKWRKYSV